MCVRKELVTCYVSADGNDELANTNTARSICAEATAATTADMPLNALSCPFLCSTACLFLFLRITWYLNFFYVDKSTNILSFLSLPSVISMEILKAFRWRYSFLLIFAENRNVFIVFTAVCFCWMMMLCSAFILVI